MSEVKKLSTPEYVKLYLVISSVERLQILFALYGRNGRERASLREFENVFRVKRPLLVRRLKILQEVGLVTVRGKPQKKYCLTAHGRKIVKWLRNNAAAA
jgi:DNA-binding MarR family transcriptional regulator